MNEKELARLAVEAESLHCNLKDFCRLLSITMDDFEDNGGLLARRKLTAGVLHVIFDYLDVLAGREAKLAAAMRGGRRGPEKPEGPVKTRCLRASRRSAGKKAGAPRPSQPGGSRSFFPLCFPFKGYCWFPGISVLLHKSLVPQGF